jgi:hypothetical protein
VVMRSSEGCIARFSSTVFLHPLVVFSPLFCMLCMRCSFYDIGCLQRFTLNSYGSSTIMSVFAVPPPSPVLSRLTPRGPPLSGYLFYQLDTQGTWGHTAPALTIINVAGTARTDKRAMREIHDQL